MAFKGFREPEDLVWVLVQRFGGKIDFKQAARLARHSERRAAIPIKDNPVLVWRAAMALAPCKL